MIKSFTNDHETLIRKKAYDLKYDIDLAGVQEILNQLTVRIYSAGASLSFDLEDCIELLVLKHQDKTFDLMNQELGNRGRPAKPKQNQCSIDDQTCEACQ